MAMFLLEIHFWSFNDSLIIPNNSASCTKYYYNYKDKLSNGYLDEKCEFLEGRDVLCKPNNKKPEQLVEKLTQLEELLSSKKCIKLTWIKKECLEIYCGDLSVISCFVSLHSCDPYEIYIDTSLNYQNLLSSLPNFNFENLYYGASDFYICKDYALAVYDNLSVANYFYSLNHSKINMNKTWNVFGKKVEKLNDEFSKKIEVPMLGTKHVMDRKILPSPIHNLVLIYWKNSGSLAHKWNQDPKKVDANMSLYFAASSTLSLVTYASSTGDIKQIKFSLLKVGTFSTIEQNIKDWTVYLCHYNCPNKKIERILFSSYAMKGPLICYDQCNHADAVVLCDDTKRLILIYENGKHFEVSSIAIKPSHLKWHPTDLILIVVNSTGDFQLFDGMLNPAKVFLSQDNLKPRNFIELSTYFNNTPSNVVSIEWNAKSYLAGVLPSYLWECNDIIAIAYHEGPIVLVSLFLGIASEGQLSPDLIVAEYVKNCQWQQAIKFLNCLNSNRESSIFMKCLSLIINSLLKLHLEEDTEEYLEQAFHIYFSPPSPLLDNVVTKYNERMNAMARRYFFKILRCKKFSKAYSLAIDLNYYDLFMDLYYASFQCKDFVMADICKKKANCIKKRDPSVTLLEESSEPEDRNDIDPFNFLNFVTEDNEEYFEGASSKLDFFEDSIRYNCMGDAIKNEFLKIEENNLLEVIEKSAELSLRKNIKDEFSFFIL